MDLDPNYDPSDFLKIGPRDSQPSHGDSASVDYSMNIKQEPSSNSQSFLYDQSSFSMSEMLQYKADPEQVDTQADVDMGEPSGIQSQSSMGQQENIAAIHDDLAISDSEEEEEVANEDEGVKKEPSDKDNDDDGDGLWFF